MPNYESLRARLTSTPFLAVDGRTQKVALVSEARAFRLVHDAEMFPAQTIINAERALANFTRLAGDTDRTFSMKETGTIAGVPYSQSYNWLLEDVLVPSVQPRAGSGKGRDLTFSFTDAYVAGLIGSLRRRHQRGR